MSQPASTRGLLRPDLQAITVKEACSRLNIPRMTLHRWEKRGIVQLIRIGGCVRVPISELERLLTPAPRAAQPLSYAEARQADTPEV